MSVAWLRGTGLEKRQRQTRSRGGGRTPDIVPALGGASILSVFLKPEARKRRWPWSLVRPRPRLLAVYSFRYDAHLVPGLLENIQPFVDGWVAFDDRAGTEAFTHEPTRRKILLDRARQEGADWVLAMDPDERLEARFAERLPKLLAAPGPRAYSFFFREMYGPSTYRVDGLWGRKRQIRLFTLQGIGEYSMDLHQPWVPPGSPHKIVPVNVNLYHLKMMTRARREGRRNLYNSLDPDRRFQGIGYDYLADEEGALFSEIPPGREYHPPHVEDGGLWMAEQGGSERPS